MQSDDICGGALEFKVDTSSLKFAQVFADIVKVANDILVHALRRGKLIENIVIYELAVFHKNKQCLPMRYICDLKKNCNLFEVGELCASLIHFHVLYLIYELTTLLDMEVHYIVL